MAVEQVELSENEEILGDIFGNNESDSEIK